MLGRHLTVLLLLLISHGCSTVHQHLCVRTATLRGQHGCRGPCMLAGGFGGSSSSKGGFGSGKPKVGKSGKGGKSGKSGKGGKSSPVASLDSDAEALLQQTGGDLNAAQAMHFQQSVMALRTDAPELFAALEAQQQAPRADVQEKLIELTWDTVAAFMPGGSSVDAELRRKLTAIAQAVCGSAAESEASGGGYAVLDVGCGDGAALPFLLKAGAAAEAYVGLDLSSRMVASAQRKAPSVRFEQGSFGSSELATPPACYDSVLFNGALQFFDDQAAALAQAARLLRSGEGMAAAGSRRAGRIVISHVNGGAFVRDEAAGNPMTVPSTMPSLEWLQQEAEPLGLRLVLPTSETDPAAARLDEFYLVVLEQERSN